MIWIFSFIHIRLISGEHIDQPDFVILRGEGGKKGERKENFSPA